ncbi:tyrosine-type recombinase/integrase [Cerasicoccus frondis]|uniref:tyrosine-type recombinase/integrase n=1 Tax=Cerasicoccus frondis TaxID=490090 RepID=UPI002852D419|nr:site-specific integrase [Cerasicoccus frondis]
MSLYDNRGQRKYLTVGECLRFKNAAGDAPTTQRLLAMTLLYTGCRVSEALELDGTRVDLAAELVVFRTLKKREKTVYRAVYVDPEFISDLTQHFNLPSHRGRLWTIHRRTALRWIKAIMKAAGIEGIHATPKGLRHSYGLACAMENLPIGEAKELMGHADVKTTLIYQQAFGAEKRAFAKRLWNLYKIGD